MSAPFQRIVAGVRMSSLIRVAPDPVLRSVAEPFASRSEIVAAAPLIATMRTAMAETNDSVAIAAPQVGVLKRAFCVHDTTTAFPFRAFFNPRLVKVHNRRRVQLYAESCLSLPNVVGIVQRPMHITVAYDDEQGDARSVELHGYWAQTVQHELDHLDGMLFTDRLAAPVTWSLDEYSRLTQEDVRSIDGLERTLFDLVAWARFDDGTHLLSKR